MRRPMLAAIGFIFAATAATRSRSPPHADQDISDAYIYLLGRLLVTRQQQLDFQEGFKWNELVHRKPGAVDWPNPNLDVAYSEAWVAVDENSCTIVSVPKVEGRYYTVHFLNGWGETIANINERLFPKRPFGEFAVCLRGANVAIPAGATPHRSSGEIFARARPGRARLRSGRRHRLATPIQVPGDRHAEASGNSQDADLRAGGVAGRGSLRGRRHRARQRAGSQCRAGSAAGESPRHRQGHQGPCRARARRSGDPHPAPSPISARRAPSSAMARCRMAGRVPASSANTASTMWRGRWSTTAASGPTSSRRCSTTGEARQAGAELSGDNVYTLTFPKDGLPAQYATFFWSVIAVDGVALPRPAQSPSTGFCSTTSRSCNTARTARSRSTSPTRSPPTRPTATGCRRRKDRSIA